MLGIALALAAAAPTVIDADIAFAKMAQDKGQWTAFRATAEENANFFTPQPISALDALKDAKDPPKSADWWPTAAWQSCDGTVGVTTGDAKWPDGHFSRYTTIWHRQPDGGWKWFYDNGENVSILAPRMPVRLVTASCTGKAPPYVITTSKDLIQYSNTSMDGSLAIYWQVAPDGAHVLHISVWNGSDRTKVHERNFAAPAK